MAGLIKRGKTYYALYYIGDVQKRVSLRTSSCQIAKEKLRQIESSLVRGEESPLPTRTSIAQAVTRYVEHIRTVKRPKSAQTDNLLSSAFLVRYAQHWKSPAAHSLLRLPSESVRLARLIAVMGRLLKRLVSSKSLPLISRSS